MVWTVTGGPQQGGQLRGRNSEPGQHEHRRGRCGHGQGVGIDHVGFRRGVLAFEHRKPGGAAHAQQQADAVDDVVDRDGQVQRGQALAAQTLGHKEGIRQNVAGHRHHAQHAEGPHSGRIPPAGLDCHGSWFCLLLVSLSPRRAEHTKNAGTLRLQWPTTQSPAFCSPPGDAGPYSVGGRHWLSTSAMDRSCSCLGSTTSGAPDMGSPAFCTLGKAMTSRMESFFSISITRRSRP